MAPGACGQFLDPLQELSAHSHSFPRTPASPHLSSYTVVPLALKETSGCRRISGTLTTGGGRQHLQVECEDGLGTSGTGLSC